MVFNDFQQPIGQADISFSLVQRHSDYLNKQLNTNNNNPSSLAKPKESLKNSLKNSKIKDNKSVTIRHNTSSNTNNNPVNTSIKNTNQTPNRSKRSMNNSQSK